MRTSRERSILAAILAVYLLLSILYSVITPMLESYDERFHFAYILSVALDHGLPVQNVDQPGPWGNEGSQPPLYYVLAAALTFWTVQPGFDQQVEPNPYTTRHLPVEQDDNRNLYVHHRTEDFPYQGNVLAFHITRWLSVLFGALAVIATYLTAKQIFPARPLLALGAAAFQAFIPSFIYVSSTASNDAAVIGLSSLALWFIITIARADFISARRAILLGVLLGLATLAKLSTVPLLAVGALAVFWAAGGRTRWKAALAKCALMLSAFGAAAGWWFVRNWLLYGEWLGTVTMNRIAGLRAQSPTMTQLWDELRFDIERNFWAAFGTGNVHPDDGWLLLPRALAILGIVGCIVLLARARAGTRMINTRTLIVLALWIVMFAIGFAWWLLRVEHLNGRLLYPLLTPFSLAVMVGLSQWMNAHMSCVALCKSATQDAPRRAIALSSVGMLALAIIMPIVSLGPAYARPPVVSAAQLAQVDHPADVIFGDSIRLWAYGVRERDMQIGKPLHVDLYWQALNPLPKDYTVYLHVLGPDDKLIGGKDSLPGRGSFPTSDWTPGVIYRDTVSVYLDTLPAEPMAAPLIVGWYETQTQKGLAPHALDGKRLSRITLGRVRVTPTEPPRYHPMHALSANFAQQIELIGYDANANAITLYWRTLRRPTSDYTAFVQIFDETGKIIAQADAPPRGAEFPTSYWEAGDVVRDEHQVSVPTHYAKILVGLYNPTTGERLKLAEQPQDAIELRE